MIKRISFFVITIIFLHGCALNDVPEEKDYETTKKMVLDIIQTDDGKKVVRDLLKEDDMKNLLVIESDDTKQAIEDTLTAEKSVDMWKTLFEDPAFIEVFYSSVKDEHTKFMKDLLADSTVQRKVIEIMQDPEMEKEFITLLKGPTFKEHLKTVIEETYDSPIFKKQTYDLMKKIIEEKENGDKKDKKAKSKEENTQNDEM